MANSPTCGALFSGIGGFCFGFEEHGFKTRWAVDIDSDAAETYRENFPKTEILCEDIRKINESGEGLEPVDVLHAGFPCQSFSRAGNKKGFNDERGELFFEIIELVKSWGERKPAVLLFENASYLLHGEGGKWFNTIRSSIQRLGYWFDEANAVLLNTYEHAKLPQKRERLFMMATSMEKFDYNPLTGISEPDFEKTTLEEIIERGEQDEGYYLSKGSKYADLVLEKAKGHDGLRLYHLRRTIVRPQRPGVCPTLTANMGGGGHNVPFLLDGDRPRKLTERECLRLQGFPESFAWANIPQGAKYRLIGNAVSPAITRRIAEAVKIAMGRHENGSA